MGGARHERQHEERITLASQERIECAWFWCWWLRSTYGKPWALRWLEALKGFGRARKGIFRFAAVSALVLFFFTSTAYAIEGFNSVIYGPVSYTWQNVTYSQIGVIASNKYNAAAVSLGYNPDDFSADVKAKLSNSSTGGSFYTYAQQYENPPVDNFSVSIMGNGQAGVSPGFWATCYGLYGEGNVWYAEVTKNSMVSAKEDLEVILNGGSLGGGSTPSNTYPAGYYYKIPTNINNYAPFSANQSFGLQYAYWSVDLYDEMVAEANWHGATIVLASKYNSTYGSPLPGINQWYTDWRLDNDSGYTFSRRGGNGNVTSGLSAQNAVINGDNSRIYYKSGSLSYGWATNSNWVQNAGPWYYVGAFNPDDFEKVYLDPNGINWPETPSLPAPTAPEVPEPDTPTTEPQPDSPTPKPSPTFPIYVDVSTTTYTADLQGILDALNDHCIHIQNALHTNFSDFWTSLSTKMTNDFATLRQYLHGQFSWLGETVQDEFSETRDYLKDLFEWLADQLDFSVSGGGYNDSTVVSWLKKIYSKLGTGTSSKPVDPVADPDQTGSWLDTLINNLLTALEDLFPGLIGQVADFFGGTLGNLTQKFPFSIPWDIAAILGMLVAEPVAPSVEIPAYTLTVDGLTQAGSYDIDLSAYDAAWGAVRIMMRIAFALYVCVHTKDFLEVIERVMM